jgi:hypothetical protein
MKRAVISGKMPGAAAPFFIFSLNFKKIKRKTGDSPLLSL